MDLIYTEASKLTQDAIIEMYELDLQSKGLGIFRFASTSNEGASIWFNGLEYIPIPITSDGFTWDSGGTLPRPTLTLHAKDLSLVNMVVDADDLVGVPVVRIKTFRKYLDDGDSPGTGAAFPSEHYVIEKKTKQSRQTLSFELSTKMDQQGKLVPKLMVLRDTCVQTYRFWREDRFAYTGVSCPYTGGRYFKRNGEEVFDPKEDNCGKKVSDCKLRFTSTDPSADRPVLPRIAFPGVGRF